ncbi:MAG: UDP-N-acetylmuramoyl-L-alanyl-D-glutamate--2,6-diaminopimelate ligase [Treponema sp.]|nr:UDP-N-acetylmuramoyl-L-alanyl-D-glutamate--2,6-diaminopimelate ligase [Treponema sp.]
MAEHLSLFFSKEIAQKAGIEYTQTGIDPIVTSLEFDSRCIKEGSLFFALPGLHTDGSFYIEEAIKRGASVIVHENEVTNKKENIVYLKALNSRFAMSPVSAAYCEYPSRRMLVTGVTGTEGKSTTVYLIWQLLTLLGKKAGFISTVQHCLGGEVTWNPEHQTTPEAPIVQRLLKEMADNGCGYAVVEASSHGLSPRTNRLGDVNFCSGVLTNITHEHLEFHGTWEQYRDDKANLFRALNNYIPQAGSSLTKPFGVVNADDKSAPYFIKLTDHRIYTFSPSGNAGDLILTSIESRQDGNRYTISIPGLYECLEVQDRLPGVFNSANVLAALLAVSGLLNIPVKEIVPYVMKLKPVRGRMTAIRKGQPFEVVVDYAHTPSSFLAIFPSIRERLDKTGGRIISLFSSPGERDTKKRSEQGKIAALYSDIIVLADEDPRGEKPMDILEEIALGITSIADEKVFNRDDNLFLIPDRPKAIRKAFSLAKRGDLVLLLGKGHENSIIYADYVMPFNEFEEAEKALGEMGYTD